MDCDLHEVDAGVGSVGPSLILVKMYVASITREKGVSQNPGRTVERLIVSVGSTIRYDWIRLDMIEQDKIVSAASQ